MYTSNMGYDADQQRERRVVRQGFQQVREVPVARGGLLQLVQHRLDAVAEIFEQARGAVQPAHDRADRATQRLGDLSRARPSASWSTNTDRCPGESRDKACSYASSTAYSAGSGMVPRAASADFEIGTVGRLDRS